MTLNERIRAARRCGTPIICIRTADPAATTARLKDFIHASKPETPIFQWDTVRGALGVDQASAVILEETLRGQQLDAKATTNAAKFLVFSNHLPQFSLVFMLNLHRFASQDITVIQALWNLRDSFKTANKCIIGLCPNITLPAELSQDVLVLDEPLPTDAQLKTIAEDIFNSAQLAVPSAADMDKIVDATLGLAAFPAEQSMAMSITKRGMDIEELWERKRSLIAQTNGLSVVKPSITLDDIGGVGNAKQFMRRVMGGAEPPRCFVFIDEGEKAFAGSNVGAGDSSGVSQNFLGTLLTTMQDEKYRGVIFVGFPGSAKSMLAKAAGATAGVPTIQFDLAGMKNAHVGESEANLRHALATVKAVSQGRAYFIMTCNGIASLPPELKRRFKDAIFFMDIPDREEKDGIWNIYLKQYATGLDGLDITRPSDDHWTGAEISTCVENAVRFRIPLREAATYIVPAFQSMGSDRAKALREEASGRFISASYPGPYNHKRETIAPLAATTGRTINFGDN